MIFFVRYKIEEKITLQKKKQKPNTFVWHEPQEQERKRNNGPKMKKEKRTKNGRLFKYGIY